jgi:hypothetical protein
MIIYNFISKYLSAKQYLNIKWYFIMNNFDLMANFFIKFLSISANLLQLWKYRHVNLFYYEFYLIFNKSSGFSFIFILNIF